MVVVSPEATCCDEATVGGEGNPGDTETKASCRLLESETPPLIQVCPVLEGKPCVAGRNMVKREVKVNYGTLKMIWPVNA